jgi:DNA-binding response OmpR family regulator
MTPSSGPATPDGDYILIVDDDATIRRSLERTLGQAGYGTAMADDGRSAFELLQRAETSPSLILIDLVMPRMSGLQLVERLERDDTLCQIPVVIMSGHSALTLGDAVRDMHVLLKPFATDELMGLVRMLGRRSASRWAVPASERIRVSVPPRR